MSQLGHVGSGKKVTEAKEGPLELRREKGKGSIPGGRERWGKGTGMLQRGRDALYFSIYHLLSTYCANNPYIVIKF